MYAIMGITGQVGGAVGRILLAATQPVRAVVRDAGKGQAWADRLDKPVPMVATADIGRVAAGLLQETWTGRCIVELEGPQRVTPNDIASTFAATSLVVKFGRKPCRADLGRGSSSRRA